VVSRRWHQQPGQFRGGPPPAGVEFVHRGQVVDREALQILAGLGQRIEDPVYQTASGVVAGNLRRRFLHDLLSPGIFDLEGPHIRPIASGAGPPVDGWKGVIVSRHRFKVGQTVHLVPNRLERHVPGGAYTIQRALPDEGRDLQYRVKNVQDGHERVVSEAQLRPAEALTPHH
jgi:hypothetical protein